MYDDFYQNSLCPEGLWLHKYMILEQFPEGVLEVCERCGDRKLFSRNVPNEVYLSYHLRSGLQRYHTRFTKEFPNALI